ncbi:hypothetical protein HD806DRAFT_536073 [Xylariaceae sp. AK1471]|nr:hypothetical protein HD806DRAFT_536073 [Xylariaceae sp. AK1471]
MGQHWKLVNFDKQETIEDRYGPMKMQEILVNRGMERLVALLAVPTLHDLDVSIAETEEEHKRNSLNRLANLLREILSVILFNLLDPSSVVSLAVTCSYFSGAFSPHNSAKPSSASRHRGLVTASFLLETRPTEYPRSAKISSKLRVLFGSLRAIMTWNIVKDFKEETLCKRFMQWR